MDTYAKGCLTEKKDSSKNIYEKVFKAFFNPVLVIFLITFLSAVFISLFSNIKIAEIVTAWGKGLTSNFATAMEFMLLLLLSYALSITPCFLSFLKKLSRLLNNEIKAVFFLVIFSTALAWLNWALGVIGDVFMAREIARNNLKHGKKINYPLLVTAGLAGLITSESGLSSNVLLTMAAPSKAIAIFGAVPISISAFSAFNILATIFTALALASVLCVFAKTKDAAEWVVDEKNVSHTTGDEKLITFAIKLENSKIVSVCAGTLGLMYVAIHFFDGGILDMKTYLFLLIALGVALRKRPLSYQKDVITASIFAWIFFIPIIFSGAIQGMLDIDSINKVISQFMLSMSNKNTFPVLVMVSSSLINLLIPNSGAQWLIAGKSILNAGEQLNVLPLTSILSFCYGAGIAKIMNIFLLMPLLSFVNVKYRHVFKYTMAMAATSTLVYITAIICLQI